MGFTPKYTHDQKQALLRLVFDDGQTVPAAVAQAAAGIDGLDPFTIRLSTAHNLAWREKRKREREAQEAAVMADPFSALERCRDLLIGALEEGTRDLTADSDPNELRGWAKTAHSIAQATAGINRAVAGAPSPTTEEDEETTTHLDPLTKRLLQQAKATADNLTEPDDAAGLLHTRERVSSRARGA